MLLLWRRPALALLAALSFLAAIPGLQAQSLPPHRH